MKRNQGGRAVTKGVIHIWLVLQYRAKIFQNEKMREFESTCFGPNKEKGKNRNLLPLTKIVPVVDVGTNRKLKLLDRVRERVHLIGNKEISELDTLEATSHNPPATGQEPFASAIVEDWKWTEEDKRDEGHQNQGPVGGGDMMRPPGSKVKV